MTSHRSRSAVASQRRPARGRPLRRKVVAKLLPRTACRAKGDYDRAEMLIVEVRRRPYGARGRRFFLDRLSGRHCSERRVIDREELPMSKLIFVNLPVGDLERATAFYEAVGAKKNERFCDGTASCMVFSETIHAMLLTHDKFRQFTPRKIADAKNSTEVLICISADSRDAVDDVVG